MATAAENLAAIDAALATVLANGGATRVRINDQEMEYDLRALRELRAAYAAQAAQTASGTRRAPWRTTLLRPAPRGVD